jgi:hypothetical protein
MKFKYKFFRCSQYPEIIPLFRRVASLLISVHHEKNEDNNPVLFLLYPNESRSSKAA